MEPVAPRKHQELPSGSQALLEVREKPGGVTRVDGWLDVTSLDFVWVEGRQCWDHPCRDTPWKCS